MRKLLVVCLTAALLLTALLLPQLTDAARKDKDKPGGRTPAVPGKGAGRQEAGASKSDGNPLMYRAVNFGESPKLSDIAQAQTKLKNQRNAKVLDREKMIEQKREKTGRSEAEINEQRSLSAAGVRVEDEAREKNDRNREIIRHLDPATPSTPDSALAKVPAGEKGRGFAPQVLPVPNVSFEGISEVNTEAIGQGFIPPDTNGEIGPSHFVQTVNVGLRIYNRNGTPATALTTIGALFAALPGVCANTNDGDPIVLYDQLADRWLISQFCWSVAVPNHQIIAISKTGDPTGAYYLYDFVMPNVKFNDYPHFGMWPDGYYMTDNQFNQAGTIFQGAGIFAFDRAKMLAGDPTASFIYFDKADGCASSTDGSTCLFGGMLPADLDGFTPPPAGTPAPIAIFDANEFGAGHTDSIRLFDFHADFATPANSTLTERTGSPVAVAAFDPREVPAGARNVVPQPAPGVALDAIMDRLMFRLAYRNFGDHESLALNHTVNAATNPLYQAGVRYYELQRAGAAAPWTVHEQATMAGAAGDTASRWMGSTALNNAGSQGVAYSVSGPTTNPSIRYAGRLAGDPAGSLTQGEQTMVAGGGVQTSTSSRWGDYSDLTVDPLDDCTFWYTNEYFAATSSGAWQTRIGSFTFGPCTPVQKGVLTGTVTSSATGTPIANATVTASNGFSRASGANGVYNIDPMGAGTFTLTVSAPNYAPATISNVSVTVGNTTTQNVQLTPLSNIVNGTAVVTADSCNSNLTLDPNELVTVNFGLLNNGGDGATTGNLVATLQATGGVLNPSGPQNYGGVVAGQPAVARPFSFQVGATCGGTVTATLQLQDGATNLGTRTFTFQVGTLSIINRSTGGIAVAIPDNLPAGVDIPITVPDAVTISDINVRVRLNHTFDSDLVISLVHPDNTSVTLSNKRGSSGANYGTGTNDCAGTPTVFDDQAANSITTGVAPFAGTFKPEGSLASLNGKAANGTWKLHIVDTANLDAGTVGCVTIEINKRFICCGSEVIAAPPTTIAAESVSPANNAVDPDETVTVNFPLKNIGGNNTTNLVATLLPTGGVLAPSAPQTYGVVTSLGATVSKPFTFTAVGACGGVITATLALQDGLTPLAPITFTIPIGGTSNLGPTTFSNTAAITIPAAANTAGESSPYPSNISVSGLSGSTSKVTVTLNNITHAFATDMDMLLVSPTGQKFIIVSDAIRSGAATNVTYTLDDAAATQLGTSGPPASGTYRPVNIGTGDTFPAPAPAAPYLNPATAGTDTFATAFNGANPNGTWSLYVVDDFRSADSGAMAGGWSLNISTLAPVCNTQACTLNVPANITVPADAGQNGAIVNYPAATFTGSCGVVTSSPASGSFFPIGTTVVTVTGTRGNNSTTTQTFTVTVVPRNPSTNLVISEFRERGTAGALDEYIEVANLSNSPFTVNATDGSAGWGVAALNAAGTVTTLVGTIPNNTTIPARGHYLIANSSVGGYSLGNYGGAGNATPNATYTADIPDNVGLALFNTGNLANMSLSTVVDAVGFTSQTGTLPALFSEGATLAPVSGNGEYAFVRKLTTGLPQDTNDNAQDFVFVAPDAGTYGGVQAQRGAPGPENMTSPTQRNATIKASLIDTTQSSTDPPNRIRDISNPGPAGSATAQGTLDVRRKFTNATGVALSRLRFRIVDVTTTNTPNPGGQQADVRLLSSIDTDANGGTITIKGTTLEGPSDGTAGGGHNSTVTVALPGAGTLANGASINVRFLLGVAANGRFRFFINVEGLP